MRRSRAAAAATAASRHRSSSSSSGSSSNSNNTKPKQQHKKKKKKNKNKNKSLGSSLRSGLRQLSSSLRWRLPWRRRSRSRSRSRSRGRKKQQQQEHLDSTDLVAMHITKLQPQNSWPLDSRSNPFDFCVQADCLLVPGVQISVYSLNGEYKSAWTIGQGNFVPLCIDCSPNLIYVTAANLRQCGIFIFDTGGLLKRSSLQSMRQGGELANEWERKPCAFAVRVNFRGECWVSNPRDATVEHYSSSLRKERTIDVSRFGTPYYVAAHKYKLQSVWVSFPESRSFAKFDWITLQPLNHVTLAVGQSPCGLHLDAFGQLYVTDIDGCQLLIYNAETAQPIVENCKVASDAIANFTKRPAVVRMHKGLLLLLSAEWTRIDSYRLMFSDD